MNQSDLAKQILSLHAFALAKKVAAGKPLTPGELETVRATAEGTTPGPQWAKSKVELAAALGVTRRSIHAWLKIPGNPGARSNGNYSVQEWRDWAMAHGRGHDESPDLAGARLRGELLKNWRADFKNRELRGEYLPIKSVKVQTAQAIQAAKTRSFSGLPRLVSLIKLARDDASALDVAKKELESVWRQMEASEWFAGTSHEDVKA
jgi:hypothetical protein